MIALAVIAGGYLALCGVARLAYPRMLFPAPRIAGTPRIDDPDASLVRFGATEGIHWPAPDGARTVVMFHGNGETIFHGVTMGTELRRRGLGVLLVEYRGYGTLHGDPPSEAMLYEDGDAAIAWLRARGVTNERLVVFGWSLGSSVAAEMAHRGHGARLVLVSPFTNIAAMGRRFAPFLPVSLLMSHELDTIKKAPSIQQPALVIHGDADELIPFAMGEKVAAALPNAKLVRVERGHHADLFWPGSGAAPNAEALFDLVAGAP
ncbi:MAG: alpha/beta hydrolase [Labilithrix sp.]|nr:alpha/beta hydrolase [Labilithrix sp.]MCW5811795.1 alpha/beta hydrolase [Labilithrix sp.]